MLKSFMTETFCKQTTDIGLTWLWLIGGPGKVTHGTDVACGPPVAHPWDIIYYFNNALQQQRKVDETCFVGCSRIFFFFFTTWMKMLTVVSVSSQGHYSLYSDDPLFKCTVGKMFKAQYLNHIHVFFLHKCVQTAQIASQTSLWLLKSQALVVDCFDAIWCHLTHCAASPFTFSVRLSPSPCLCETWSLMWFAWHPLLSVHTSANSPDTPIATADGRERWGLSLRERHRTSPPHLTQSVPM